MEGIKPMVNIPSHCEPKKTNRWLGRFPVKLGIQEWWQYETSRPSVFFDGEDVIYNPITFKLRDVIGPSSSQAINKIMIGMTNHLSHIEDSHATTKKIKEEFKEERENGFDYTLELLDPTGHVIEEWAIIGCKLVSIDYGDLSMDSDNLCEITMVIQPKTFIQLY